MSSFEMIKEPTRSSKVSAACNDDFSASNVREVVTEHASASASLLSTGLRKTIYKQFERLASNRPHMLHLAFTEAAALAWQTGFPQLFFPTLVMEKAESMAVWESRQIRVKKSGPTPPLHYPRACSV